METMETGGLGWFSDLTIPDPYYGLSLALASTTFIQVTEMLSSAVLDGIFCPTGKK